MRHSTAAAVAALALGLPTWAAAQAAEDDAAMQPDTTTQPGDVEQPDTTMQPGDVEQPDTTMQPGSIEQPESVEPSYPAPYVEEETLSEEELTEEEPYATPEEPYATPEMEPRKKGGPGAAVTAGGGVSDFSRSEARDFLDLGGAWDLRGIFGTRTFVGVEAAYIGAAYQISAVGDADTLWANGAEVSGRFNILRNRGESRGVQPYVLGGVAWKYYQLSGDLATADVEDNDNTFEVPVGGGLAYWFDNGMMLDGRFAYRFAFDNDLIQPVGDDEANLDNWNAIARLGAEF